MKNLVLVQFWKIFFGSVFLLNFLLKSIAAGQTTTDNGGDSYWSRYQWNSTGPVLFRMDDWYFGKDWNSLEPLLRLVRHFELDDEPRYWMTRHIMMRVHETKGIQFPAGATYPGLGMVLERFKKDSTSLESLLRFARVYVSADGGEVRCWLVRYVVKRLLEMESGIDVQRALYTHRGEELESGRTDWFDGFRFVREYYSHARGKLPTQIKSDVLRRYFKRNMVSSDTAVTNQLPWHLLDDFDTFWGRHKARFGTFEKPEEGLREEYEELLSLPAALGGEDLIIREYYWAKIFSEILELHQRRWDYGITSSLMNWLFKEVLVQHPEWTLLVPVDRYLLDRFKEEYSRPYWHSGTMSALFGARGGIIPVLTQRVLFDLAWFGTEQMIEEYSRDPRMSDRLAWLLWYGEYISTQKIKMSSDFKTDVRENFQKTLLAVHGKLTGAIWKRRLAGLREFEFDQPRFLTLKTSREWSLFINEMLNVSATPSHWFSSEPMELLDLFYRAQVLQGYSKASLKQSPWRNDALRLSVHSFFEVVDLERIHLFLKEEAFRLDRFRRGVYEEGRSFEQSWSMLFSLVNWMAGLNVISEYSEFAVRVRVLGQAVQELSATQRSQFGLDEVPDLSKKFWRQTTPLIEDWRKKLGGAGVIVVTDLEQGGVSLSSDDSAFDDNGELSVVTTPSCGDFLE